jgi:hypothetical protein
MTITSDSRPLTLDLNPPAIRLEHRARREPLDLDAEVFRYRVLGDGTIAPLRDGVRNCSSVHPRRHR